jgi:hypothetical protein
VRVRPLWARPRQMRKKAEGPNAGSAAWRNSGAPSRLNDRGPIYHDPTIASFLSARPIGPAGRTRLPAGDQVPRLSRDRPQGR